MHHSTTETQTPGAQLAPDTKGRKADELDLHGVGTTASSNYEPSTIPRPQILEDIRSFEGIPGLLVEEQRILLVRPSDLVVRSSPINFKALRTNSILFKTQYCSLTFAGRISQS